MSGWTRRNLPAEIAVFAGNFASQPLAFAHLLDVAPGLDLDHVEVIPRTGAEARLGAYFDAGTVAHLAEAAALGDTLVLILPTAHDGIACPVAATEHLTPLGGFRGTVPRLVATRDGR